MDLLPDSQLMSPLTLKTVVKKVATVRKALQHEFDAVNANIKEDKLEMCRRWRERKRNFVSAAVSRAICLHL
jgi:hypothetical protein